MANRIGGVEIKGETLAEEMEPVKLLHGMVNANKAGIGNMQTELYEIRSFMDTQLNLLRTSMADLSGKASAINTTNIINPTITSQNPTASSE